MAVPEAANRIARGGYVIHASLESWRAHEHLIGEHIDYLAKTLIDCETTVFKA